MCNSLLYTLLHTAALEYPGLRGGFLHVPYAAEQLSGKPVGTFAMPLPDIARALTRAVEAISETCKNNQMTAGCMRLRIWPVVFFIQ